MVEKKHTSLELDEDIWKELKFKSIDEGKSLGELIRRAIVEYYDFSDRSDIPDSDDIGIEGILSKMDSSTSGSSETIREITKSNLEYLKSVGTAQKKNFVKNVYPEFEDEHTKDAYWKVSQNGFSQLSDVTDKVKTPSKGHSKYKWKG